MTKIINHEIALLQQNIEYSLKRIHTSKYDHIWLVLYWAYKNTTEDIYDYERKNNRS